MIDRGWRLIAIAKTVELFVFAFSVGVGLIPGLSTIGTLHVPPGNRDNAVTHFVAGIAVRASQSHDDTVRP